MTIDVVVRGNGPWNQDASSKGRQSYKGFVTTEQRSFPAEPAYQMPVLGDSATVGTLLV